MIKSLHINSVINDGGMTPAGAVSLKRFDDCKLQCTICGQMAWSPLVGPDSLVSCIYLSPAGARVYE